MRLLLSILRVICSCISRIISDYSPGQVCAHIYARMLRMTIYCRLTAAVVLVLCYRLHILFFHTHLLSSFWTSRGHRCRSFFPPLHAYKIYCAWGSANPLLVDFSSRVANVRSRAFRKSICAQEKVPTNIYDFALRGFELTKLTYTRLEDNLIRHLDDRPL